jgi:membrane associated rhomboid family serine protease
MLPLRDDIPSRRVPVVTIVLILINLMVFLWELGLGPRLEHALLSLSIIPVRYTDPEIRLHFGWMELVTPFFTSLFLHGGWLHLFSNLWVLWIFGDNVEDRLGHRRFLLFYLAAGVAASALHILTNPHSHLFTLGASGAIAGVMGAYFRLYPRARVLTLIPPFVLGPYFVLPAVVFLGFWFLLQFFSGTLSLGADAGAGGVAWWAHVGGFAFGVVCCLFVRRQPPVLPGGPARSEQAIQGSAHD